MARKPQNYWEKRQTKLMKRIENNTEPTINELISVYREATHNINKEIVKIYNNYGKDSGLNQQALMHLLNSRETQIHYDNLLKVIQNNIKDEDLKKKLLAKYTAPAYNYRISRFQELQEQIDLQLKIAADRELEITRIKYADTIKETYNRNMFDIQKGLGFQFQFNAIDNKTINLMLKEKWTNKGNFSTRIWKNNEKLGEYLKVQLSAASLSGKSVQRISSDLAHYMQVGMSQATTLVRTEMNHFANEAEMMAYQELDIEEYQFIATLDKVTCMHCAKLDKRKFKVKERKVGVNYPPIHPNDRCTTIAVIDDEVKEDLLRIAKDDDGNTIFIPQDMNYSQWKEAYAGNMSTKQKNDDKINANIQTIKNIKSVNIEYNPVQKLNKELEINEIIERISGGDETKGSCSSAALTYIGNRNGLDVLDFRGGESQSFFSTPQNVLKMCDDLKINYEMELNYNDTLGAMKLLNKVEQGKEYYLSTGAHAAIVRKTNGNLEYLELQDKENNGFKQFTPLTLKNRFGCKQTHTLQGTKLKARNLLIDIDEFKDKDEFREILGYINTPVNKQQKGENGNAK